MQLKLTIILFLILSLLIMGAVLNVAHATAPQYVRATTVPMPTVDVDAPVSPYPAPDEPYPAPGAPAQRQHHHSAPKATPSGLTCDHC
jgi:hypothetical protein